MEDTNQRAFELFAVEVLGRRPTSSRVSLWTKLALSSVLFLVTFGLLDVVPKSYVRIIDRRTRVVVLEHAWQDPRVAVEDAEQIEARLKELTAAEFASEYGIDVPAR